MLTDADVQTMESMDQGNGVEKKKKEEGLRNLGRFAKSDGKRGSR